MKTMKDGFSLVEIIIAIAILALLSLPILAYFTNAAVSTTRGRDTQKATLAAESVVEQITNSGSYDNVEDVLSSATGWTLDSKASPSDNRTLLTKVVTEDGENYQAKVTIDYDYSRVKPDGSNTDSKYNDYETPELNAIYSPSNVIIAEDDQISTAVSHFVTLFPDDSQSAIKSGLQRTISLSVMNDPENGDNYVIKGSYIFEYKSDTYEAVIDDLKIEKSRLQKIYYMYNIYSANETTNVQVQYDTSITTAEAQAISIYYICQKKVLAPAGHSLNFVAMSGTSMQSEYFTNGITCMGVTADTDFVKHVAAGKRIAKISVDIYDEGETTYNSDTRIVHLDTAKGER